MLIPIVRRHPQMFWPLLFSSLALLVAGLMAALS